MPHFSEPLAQDIFPLRIPTLKSKYLKLLLFAHNLVTKTYFSQSVSKILQPLGKEDSLSRILTFTNQFLHNLQPNLRSGCCWQKLSNATKSLTTFQLSHVPSSGSIELETSILHVPTPFFVIYNALDKIFIDINTCQHLQFFRSRQQGA